MGSTCSCDSSRGVHGRDSMSMEEAKCLNGNSDQLPSHHWADDEAVKFDMANLNDVPDDVSVSTCPPSASEQTSEQMKEWDSKNSCDSDEAAQAGAVLRGIADGFAGRCRICQGVETLPLLVSPCACANSPLLAHRKCLVKWMQMEECPQDLVCRICRCQLASPLVCQGAQRQPRGQLGAPGCSKYPHDCSTAHQRAIRDALSENLRARRPSSRSRHLAIHHARQRSNEAARAGSLRL
mmetsp:Transcript_49507/g.115810  ORF Transcript_49507/g.115810 Transcript_49507/m.115810 type:complete len:238 (+) Transcript_49507:73-786(+)